MTSGDLIVCSLEPWDDVWRRNQFLLAGLLEGDPGLRVLLVEPPADPLFELGKRRAPTLAKGLRAIPGIADGRLWAYQPTKIVPRLAGAFADRILSLGVVRVAARLGFQAPLLWINDPSRAPLLAQTRWPALYDITDDWLVANRPPRERSRLRANESLLMQRCAAVVVCSPQLAKDKGRTRPVVLIPNAVDVERYRRPAERPPDLPDAPTALYVGTLHEDRLDIDLCLSTARRLAGIATLVLLGPTALSEANTARLAEAENVALLGPRPNAAIPAYLQHADVLITPHVVTDFTESLDPIKLYEYLAAGRPIVATPVAGFRESAGPIALASAENFPEAVVSAIDAAPLPDGVPLTLPTWGTRVAQMRAVLDEVAASARQSRN